MTKIQRSPDWDIYVAMNEAALDEQVEAPRVSKKPTSELLTYQNNHQNNVNRLIEEQKANGFIIETSTYHVSRKGNVHGCIPKIGNVRHHYLEVGGIVLHNYKTRVIEVISKSDHYQNSRGNNGSYKGGITYYELRVVIIENTLNIE